MSHSSIDPDTDQVLLWSPYDILAEHVLGGGSVSIEYILIYQKAQWNFTFVSSLLSVANEYTDSCVTPANGPISDLAKFSQYA